MLISGVRFIQVHPNTGQHDNLDYKDRHFPGGEGGGRGAWGNFWSV